MTDAGQPQAAVLRAFADAMEEAQALLFARIALNPEATDQLVELALRCEKLAAKASALADKYHWPAPPTAPVK